MVSTLSLKYCRRSLSGGLVEMKDQVTSMFLFVKPLLEARDRVTAELQSPITVLPADIEPVLVEITA
jgi:hypothetical protein